VNISTSAALINVELLSDLDFDHQLRVINAQMLYTKQKQLEHEKQQQQVTG
jgi:hypothetical protein